MTGEAVNTATTIPRFMSGTWTIDPVHSEVSFTVRHLMVSKVRGRFAAFSGSIVTDSDPLHSQVSAEIDLASIDTGNAQRDAHLRSAEFLDVGSTRRCPSAPPASAHSATTTS